MNVYRTRIPKICVGIVWLVAPLLSHSQSKLLTLRLCEVDTASLNANYLFIFRDTARRYNLIAPKKAVPREGCWVKPIINQRYLLNVREVGEFDIGGATLQLHDRGLYIDGPDSSGKEILAPGENFFMSDEANGLFIKGSSR